MPGGRTRQVPFIDVPFYAHSLIRPTLVDDEPSPSKKTRVGADSSSRTTTRPDTPSSNHSHSEILEKDCDDLPGEIPLENEEPDDDDDDDTALTSTLTLEKVPVRRITDFSVYDAKGNLVLVNALLQANLCVRKPDPPKGKSKKRKRDDQGVFYASGVVKAKDPATDDDLFALDMINEDLHEDGEDTIRLKIGPILQINVHHFNEEFDPLVWILTRHAWYILECPSDAYAATYAEFLVPHQVVHTVLTSLLETPHVTLDVFQNTIQQRTDLNVQNILGRSLTVQDLEDSGVVAYLLGTIPDVLAKAPGISASHPLLVSLFGESVEIPEIESSAGSAYGDDEDHPHPRSKKKKKSDVDFTVATETVFNLSEHLFKSRIESLQKGDTGLDAEQLDKVQAIKNVYQAHIDDPTSMVWGKFKDSEASKTYYESVMIDGIGYSIGDTVALQPGKDSRSSTSKNLLAKAYWFCIIRYFYELNGVKYLHGQWFEHGSHTLLQELSHSKMLYLLNSCDDHKLETVVQKVDLTFMRGVDDKEPDDDKEENDANFFCFYVYNEKQLSFSDLPSLEDEELLQCDEEQRCLCCAANGTREAEMNFCRVKSGFRINGDEYHLHDFVYIQNENPKDDLLHIAQIVAIPTTKKHVEIRYLKRMDNISRLKPDEKYVAQSRRLYMGQESQCVSVNRLHGHCYVQVLQEYEETTITQWTDLHTDHFYLNSAQQGDRLSTVQKNSISQCFCLDARIAEMENQQTLRSKHSPLRGMELFAGAGGLGLGMDMSNCIETKWAVEFMPSAAKTYAENHKDKDCIVYCQDVNKLLAHRMDLDDPTKDPSPLLSNGDEVALPPLPKRGEVDIISGGPPCQAFSRANHCPKPDDIRAALPMTMLSFVEYYEPRYFILENVTGILGHRLLARAKAHGRALEGGIEMGVMKLISRVSMALCYQISFKVLQAGQYGAPQSRYRVIIIGTRRGWPMPLFPIPTHAFGKHTRFTCPGVIEYSIDGDGKKAKQGKSEPVSRSKNPDHAYGGAPLKAVSVNDAIGDLPKFEWISPRFIMKNFPRKEEQAKRERDEHIQQFDAVSGKNDLTVGYSLVGYRTVAQTAYQKLMRRESQVKVSAHETSSYSATIIETAVNIPMIANANHKQLPKQLIQPKMIKLNSKGKKTNNVFYGRLDGNDSFRTALTTVSPGAKGSILLHPNQRRVVTVREAARAQGFPDWYEFQSDKNSKVAIIKDQYKQIGNAVPVPLALALGRAVGEADMKALQQKKQRGGSVGL